MIQCDTVDPSVLSYAMARDGMGSHDRHGVNGWEFYLGDGRHGTATRVLHALVLHPQSRSLGQMVSLISLSHTASRYRFDGAL